MTERFVQRQQEQERAEAEQQRLVDERQEELNRQEDEARDALRERRAQDAKERARLDFYRPMELDLRARRLARCREEGFERRQDLGVDRDCDTLLLDLLSVSATDEEKAILVRANEEAIELVRKRETEEQQKAGKSQRHPTYSNSSDASTPSGDSASSSGSGRLRCCDGTLSPSCTCGGSRRGCCSHHGGVCGCD